MKFIGFIGIEESDIVICLAQIISRLNKRTLVLDLSDTKALTGSIGNPLGLGIYNYHGFDFTALSQNISKDVLVNYDYILIDFGLNRNSPFLKICAEVWFTGDQRPQYIKLISDTKLSMAQARFFILKEWVEYRDVLPEYLEILKPLHITRDTSYVLTQDNDNYGLMLNMLYGMGIDLKKISADLSNLLKIMLIEDFEEADINRVIKSAGGGK